MALFDEAKSAINGVIKAISARVDNRNENLLRMALGEVLVYLEFLELVYSRYREVGDQYIANNQQLQESLQKSPGTHTITDTEMVLFEQNRNLHLRLRLEIESFYVFAHILLNKTVNFPKRYFAHPHLRGVKCGSHTQFWDSIQGVVSFAPIPQDLLDNANWLSEKVVSYRDKLITHTLASEHFQRMLIRGMTWQLDGAVRISSNTLFPDEKIQNQVDSEKLEAIVPRLQTYLQGFAKFLLHHVDKSILHQEQQPQN